MRPPVPRRKECAGKPFLYLPSLDERQYVVDGNRRSLLVTDFNRPHHNTIGFFVTPRRLFNFALYRQFALDSGPRWYWLDEPQAFQPVIRDHRPRRGIDKH